MLPPRTYETQAGHAIGQLELDAVVAWAVDALAAGHDSRSLRMLAGLEPPLDQLEVGRLHAAAFRELGIPPLPAAAHVRCYITHTLGAMLAGDLARKEALHRLADLYIDHGYDRQLRDFYLLYHAKWDLESEHVQFYRKDADRSTIDQEIDAHAKSWLEQYAKDEAV